MARALRLLAQREHSRAELERKLLARTARDASGTDESGDHQLPDALRDQVTQVLDDLQRGGWLNDSRAAEALVQARAQRYGARRLGQLLRDRSFDAELISRSLEAAKASELERARAVWARRFGHPPADAREQARQMRFLLGRGFDAATAAHVVRHAGATDEEPPGAPTPQPRHAAR